MPEGSHRFQVGSINCTVLSDGYYSYPAPGFSPMPTPPPSSARSQAITCPADEVLSPYTCLLIETGRHVVLVDTGAGDYSRTSGAIQARLEVAGIRPKDVDTVIITHAHPDHIGGAIDLCGRPAFPNARYVLSEIEWEFGPARAPTCPLRVPKRPRNRCNPWRAAASAFCAIRSSPSPRNRNRPRRHCHSGTGHTPGHLAVLIESEGERCSISAMPPSIRCTWSNRRGKMASIWPPRPPSTRAAS